jgi:hypothetical protein
MTISVAKKRFIFGLGLGTMHENQPLTGGRERILRLDTLKLHKSWQRILVKNIENSWAAAIFPLGIISENRFEFLIFGGQRESFTPTSRCYILNTNLADFSQTTIYPHEPL